MAKQDFSVRICKTREAALIEAKTMRASGYTVDPVFEYSNAISWDDDTASTTSQSAKVPAWVVVGRR